MIDALFKVSGLKVGLVQDAAEDDMSAYHTDV